MTGVLSASNPGPEAGPRSPGDRTNDRSRVQALPGRAAPTVLVDCRVIDLEHGTFEPAGVVVREGVIESIGQTGAAPWEAGATVLGLDGAWLLPGLVDAHAHLAGTSDPPPGRDLLDARLAAYLRAGVTTLRDAGARDASVAAMATEVRAPLILAAGRPIRHSGFAASAIETSLANVGAGAAWLKAYELEPVELAGVMDVARSAGLRVGAHLGSDSARSLETGLEAIEHVYTLIRHDLVPYESRIASSIPAADRSVATWFLADPDAEWVAAWYDSVGGRRPFVTSTLAVMNALKGRRAAAGRETAASSPWASDDQWGRWRSRLEGWGWWDLEPGSSRDLRDQAFENICRTARRLAVAGARICVGTDFGEPLLEPGADVLTEMKLLRFAGLSMLDVLRAATCVPADLLGLGSVIGVLAEGARADIVAVASNPLESLESLARPVMVVAGGEVVVDRRSLSRRERSA